MESNYCFYFSSVKWGEAEKFYPDQIRQWSSKLTGFFNSHVFVLNLSQWSLPAVIPASHSLAFCLWEKVFSWTSYLVQRCSFWVPLYTNRPIVFILPAKPHISPIYQKILTLPEGILFWKAYQDALLSIALSHPLHHKASKSP